MAALRKLLGSALAGLALAACGEPATNTPDGPASAPDAAAPSPAQESPTTPAPTPPASAAPEDATIPAAFHGVWAATPEDCDGPAETRLEISADRLRFYESSGPVGSVEVSSPSEILITVTLTGEGAMSQRSFRYRLLDDGQGLFDVRNGLRRIRCPTA